MSGARPDLREIAREDERRKRDEAKIIALQSQVDEMRQMVREVLSRQGRNEDQFKNYELALSQVRGLIEQHRHEGAQGAQARQMEDARVRQQLSELDARIEETGRPIRSLQAHVAEVVDTLRRGRDDTQDDQRRYDELKAAIEHIAALAERNVGVVQVMRDSIEGVRTDLEQTQRDLLKAEDDIKIVEQDVRRRLAEVNQNVENLAALIDDMRPIFSQLDAKIDDVRDSITHIDPALEALSDVDTQVQEDIARFYSQTVERDDLLSERIDEVRRHLDTQARDIRQIGEQRHDRLSQRVDGLIDVDRELSYRQNLIEMRLEELRDVDLKLRRELWYLHEIQTRRRLEQVQAELEQVNDARRVAEAEMSNERTERPAERAAPERPAPGERPGGLK
jgi:chromosome segregation protein